MRTTFATFHLGICLLLFAPDGLAGQSTFALGRASHQLTFNSNGALISALGCEYQPDEVDTAGEVRYGGQKLRLASPSISSSQQNLLFTYHWPEAPGLEMTVQHELLCNKRNEFVWKRRVRVQCQTLTSQLTVSLQSWPERLPRDTWLPVLNGTGGIFGTNQIAAYRFAGPLPQFGVELALPMISVPMPRRKNRLLIAADPYFSTIFTPAAIEWTYPANPGLESGCEERTIVVALEKGSIDDSLHSFFRLALPEIEPGPSWLHEIAMVDFDYLSDEGSGWFRDIDALAARLPKKRDRHQALFCLHGCYDFLGRYCFDASTGKLDQNWISFSSYELARNAHPYGTIGGDRVSMSFANCKPHEMSLAEEHRRLQYARAHGFRVGLYFADGLNAGDGLPDFDPSRVLQWGGWQGPDSKGKSYIQNPLHPKVRDFFIRYTQALLAEFGRDIDALVWDETFHIPCGTLGTKAYPGYGDRAMMRLVHDITLLVQNYNREHHCQIAFLTSDCLGAVAGPALKAPYAIVSHGTYQDSWCQPQAWPYGIFANYPNVLWSCCWWPVTKWSWVEFGVREYQAPVSISNGWGDDTGFSEMTPAQQSGVVTLFNWRKRHSTHLKWFAQLPSGPGQ